MTVLILQMQISLDGFAEASNPNLNWQEWDWGERSGWDTTLRQDFNTVFDPTAVGQGDSIFGAAADVGLKYRLRRSRPYECGIVVNHYAPRQPSEYRDA